MSTQARETFARWVHDAYSHLYDSHHLQNHPLGELLTLSYAESDGFQRSQLLRRVLLDAIQLLRPQPKTPAQSPDWRHYSLLELRYIERLNPLDAMQQLSLSKSQFFRDQARALELVTDLLWSRAQLVAEAVLATRTNPPLVCELGDAAEAPESPSVQMEFHTTTWRLIHLGELLEDLLPVIQPLADLHQVGVEIESMFELPPVRGDRVMLRQALLNVLTFAITSTTTQRVAVLGHGDQERIALRLTFGLDPEYPAGDEQASQGNRLNLAAQIMEAVGGDLSEQTLPDEYTILLTWPSMRQNILLMIDDNSGLVELFRRYLASEPWQIVWAKNGLEARQELERTTPTVILLDIMMPEEDGWEILVQLKQQPCARHTPILICSVVNEPGLAESLGAAGYLTKPVSQESLLAALAPWQ